MKTIKPVQKKNADNPSPKTAAGKGLPLTVDVIDIIFMAEKNDDERMKIKRFLEDYNLLRVFNEFYGFVMSKIPARPGVKIKSRSIDSYVWTLCSNGDILIYNFNSNGILTADGEKIIGAVFMHVCEALYNEYGTHRDALRHLIIDAINFFIEYPCSSKDAIMSKILRKVINSVKFEKALKKEECKFRFVVRDPGKKTSKEIYKEIKEFAGRVKAAGCVDDLFTIVKLFFPHDWDYKVLLNPAKLGLLAHIIHDEVKVLERIGINIGNGFYLEFERHACNLQGVPIIFHLNDEYNNFKNKNKSKKYSPEK